MKKKNLLFICDDVVLFNSFIKKKKSYSNIIVLSANILFLEKNVNENVKSKLHVYPLTFNEFDIISFFLLLEKKKIDISEVIFYQSTELDFDKYSKFTLDLENNNFSLLLVLLKYLNNLIKKKSLKCNFTLFLSKKHTNKGNFLLNCNFINNLFSSSLREFSIKYFDFFFNIISIENLNYSYKKKFYPYRIHRFIYKDITDVYNKIILKKMNNKIFVV